VSAHPDDGGEAAASRRGYLALGSNLGDRRWQLQAAATALAVAAGLRVTASSHTYETEPVGLVLDQPQFLNACLAIETELEPDALLVFCKRLERDLGRVPTVRHGPRAIDVDILLLGNERYSSPTLTIPHAELSRRRFVLVPLLELDPDLALPSGARLADALAALGPGQRVRLAGEPLSV
jgi:2-amino-4-hydroxy-6-hydroxymethyldihydropteridine diphosphokinase